VTPLLKPSLIIYVVLGFTAQALSQQSSSSEQAQSEVSVTVTDAKGGRVPGAEVTVTCLSTGSTANERTNDKGQVLFKLTKGEYSFTAKYPGFKWTTMTDVRVQPPAPIRLSLELHPGETHTIYD